MVKEPALTNEEQLLLAVLPPLFLNKPIEIVFDRLHVCYSRLHQTQFLRPNEFLSSCKFVSLWNIYRLIWRFLMAFIS